MPVTINGNGAISGLVIATGDIADGAVTTPKIADGAVATVDIADGAVTLPKMANVATGTVLGRSTAGVGVPEALTTLPAVSGTNLTALNASNLGSGTVPDARFPATLPIASGANLTNLNASNLATGTVPDARFPATLPAVSGANLTNLNASNLASGTVGTARLGTGTANSTTFLRGDGTWATAGGAPANFSDIGTVTMAAGGNTSWQMPGSTIAGSSVYVPSTFVTAPSGINNLVFTENSSATARPNTQIRGVIQGAVHYGSVQRSVAGNQGFSAPGGFTAQSGTWRVLSVLPPRQYDYANAYGENTGTSSVSLVLMQRIA